VRRALNPNDKRRPAEEKPKAGLNRFMRPSIKLRERNNKDARRFGVVTIERGSTYNNEDES
jgi:hypothetical protein